MQKELNEYIVPNIEIDSKKRAVIVHKDYMLRDELLKEPLRNSYCINALDIDSFVGLVNEYKESSSKLFFDDKSIKCIVDFNTKDKAEFCEKRIGLNLAYTPFYSGFIQSLDMNLSQRDFIFLLKSLFMYITKIDGRPNDNMDVIELAQSLQAVKKFDSIQKNTSSKISLDVEIKSGAKENLTLPNKITFKLPIYEADVSLMGEFEVELFVDIKNDSEFSIKLICYTAEIIRREVLNQLVKNIQEKCDDVTAYKASLI
ncbi:DUF2303 family protein [Campylobacter sp. faydin G-140]|uniref:DUF2303 family protein n=1 Tax=Campylobacter anatolicus TaxID=2829105 RepID=UPI001BA095CB|nr:DUF2303 family protein [Campylobacter anatolicus]MBR8466355.1 DUF2303 family protein [Campylobacter anatolicus]